MLNEGSTKEGLCDSISGVLRSYSELLQIGKARFEGKLVIAMIADGLEDM